MDSQDGHSPTPTLRLNRSHVVILLTSKIGLSMRIALLIFVAAVLGTSPSIAQPVPSPVRHVQLSIEVFENGDYRPLRADEGPTTSTFNEAFRWRGLVDGERVSEEAFFQHAGERHLSQKAAHEHLGMRRAVVGGALAFVSGSALAATSGLLPEGSSWEQFQRGFGASIAVVGLAISSVGIHSLGRNTATVWEAQRVANQHNERASETAAVTL